MADYITMQEFDAARDAIGARITIKPVVGRSIVIPHMRHAVETVDTLRVETSNPFTVINFETIRRNYVRTT